MSAVLLAAEPVPAPTASLPPVEDVLLAPAPRPGHEIATWDDALVLLRRSSTDDRAAAAAVERAQGRWRQSLSALLPNARANAAVSRDMIERDRPTAPTTTAAASGSLAVVDVGAWQGLDAATEARRGARYTHQDVRRRLTLGLARTLVAVVAAERVAELNRLGLRQALERALLTERTQELGAATQVDVVRVRQDVEVARVTLLAGDEQLMRTREALALLLGLPGQAGVAPGFSLDGLVAETEKRCKPLGESERADVRAAKAGVEAAKSAKREAASGYLPTLDLTTNAFASADPENRNAASWNVAAVLSFPIWEGGFREGLVQERRAGQKAAAAELEATVREVSQEVERARRNVKVAKDLAVAAAESRRLAAQLDALTRRGFEVGRGSSLELVLSAAALRQADVQLASREFDLVQFRLDAWMTEATCDW